MFEFQVPEFKDVTLQQMEEGFHQWFATSTQHDLDRAIQSVFDEQQRRILERDYKTSSRIESIFEGRWLKTARRAMYLSGTNLAQRIGVQRTTYSQIENRELDGSLTLAKMKAMADAMGCEFVYFLRPVNQTFARTVWDAVVADAAKNYRVQMATDGTRVKALISVVREELEKLTSKKKPKPQRFAKRYSPKTPEPVAPALELPRDGGADGALADAVTHQVADLVE